MKTFVNSAAQGDLLIVRIQENNLPDNIVPATAKDADANGNYIVAHSETGHHHVIEQDDVDFFHAANDGVIDEFVSYLKVKRNTVLKHMRSFDTHEPIGIGPGLYKLLRQREYIPEGFRKAQD